MKSARQLTSIRSISGSTRALARKRNRGLACRAILLFLLLSSAQNAVAQSDEPQRLALVIGNAAYTHNRPLKNPVHDAHAMARLLRNEHFEVITLEDATGDDLVSGIVRFEGRLQPDAIAVLYYSGHGMQVRGKNYLVPVDAEIRPNVKPDRVAIDVDKVIDLLHQAKTRLSLIILDSCRTNPYQRELRSFLLGGDRSFEEDREGLAPQANVPFGSIISYATGPNMAASDGPPGSKNGLYTTSLIHALGQPGVDVFDAFRMVSAEVNHASGGKQVPWLSMSVGPGAVVLNGTGRDLSKGALEERPVEVLPGTPLNAESIAQCDRLAGVPGDPQGSGLGASRDELAAVRDQAIAACRVAVADAPDEARLWYELGRALEPVDKWSAVDAYRRASEAGHVYAMTNFGLLLYRDQQASEGLQWLQRAAASGDDNARQALQTLGR
jgi:hypothetical protein